MWKIPALFFALALGLASAPDPASPATKARWWKGNTHTHTLWSDGDQAPEAVAAWYKEQGYHFLVLSDHNILSRGEKWFPVSDQERSRLTSKRLEALQAQFGKAVQVRSARRKDGTEGREMRLQTLPELRRRFEEKNRFVLVEGEEVTDDFKGKPVHINALNLESLIPPQHGNSLLETLQNNLRAIAEHGRKHRRPVLAHVNHPNFGWALGAEQLAQLREESYFEVYNGHRGVRNYGDAKHPSCEQLWDQALKLRLQSGLPLLYGLATDDAHHYHGEGVANPGRGWVWVRSDKLNANSIVKALNAGEFYASSGVRLQDFRIEESHYRIWIEAEEGIEYTTTFIGCRRRGTEWGPAGEILATVKGRQVEYAFKGDELYVRAKIESTKAHPNPYAKGDRECAWLQPARP
ncbi:MAG: histidinol-phosphatase [Planctomycetota bacterium]|nr:MAG: histidinol-phosphatase [Planctomycetota bacterium]